MLQILVPMIVPAMVPVILESVIVSMAMKDTTVRKVFAQFFVRDTVRMQVAYVTVRKGGKGRNVTFQHTTVSPPTVPEEVNVSPAIATVKLAGKDKSAMKRTAWIQHAVAMALVCVEGVCAERDGEVPPAVNVTRGYNVVFRHVPNAASMTLTQEDVYVTHFTLEMIALKSCVHWTADRMVYVLKVFAVAMMVGQARCVTKDPVTLAVMTTANARTALVYVRKDGMADIVLCLVVQMAVLVMANVFWKMAYTDAPALTAGPAPTAPSLLNSLAMTTKTMMKMA